MSRACNDGPQSRWRAACEVDDVAIVAMCLALNDEDPGDVRVTPDQIRRTLTVFREDSTRGRALIAEVDGQVAGYALIVGIWSNELGGEVCVVDELFIVPERRRHGLATALIESLRDCGDLCSDQAVAVALEVASSNKNARAFFVKQGFAGSNIAMHLARRSPKRERQ